MCSTSTTSSSSSHFANFVHRTTSSCLKPGRGSTVEPVRLSKLNSNEVPKKGESDHEGALIQKTPQTAEGFFHEIFSTISNLKVSYIQLQDAHVPYDVEKLQMADKEIITDMKKLSELKHYYKENAARFIGEGDSSSKDMEIRSLKKALESLNLKNQELKKRLRQNTGADMDMDEFRKRLLEENIVKAKECAASFTKCLVSLMKSAEWDVDAAANSIEPGIDYSKPGHKKLAFQSYVCGRMFQGFEHETFYLTGTMSSIMDVEKHRNECLEYCQSSQDKEPWELSCMDSVFGKFCMKKFIQVVHPKMEESFFGNFEHRDQIAKGSSPRSPFYNVFVRFAKAVWLVHKMAFSLEPTASIFTVNAGMDFDEIYMENLNFQQRRVNDHFNEGSLTVSMAKTKTKSVGFSVMPGFRAGNKVISRCQIYAI